MTTEEWNRLLPYWHAKCNAPTWSGVSRRSAKNINKLRIVAKSPKWPIISSQKLAQRNANGVNVW